MNKAVEEHLYGLVAFWMPRPMGKNQSGFSLVEIVLVLAIIGLLLGGVFKGTAMVHQAKVRKTAQMVEDIRTASNLFYREQGRLPGDGPMPSNPVGLLDGWIKSANGTEPDQFRRELIANRYLTGTLSGLGAAKWQNALGGEIWVEYTSNDFATILNFIVVTGITDTNDLKILDLQFDDGVTTSGSVRYSGSKLFIPL